MALDRELLKNILNEMGYDVEFDSKTPGVDNGNSIINWSEIPTVLELKKSNIKEYESKGKEVDADYSLSFKTIMHNPLNKEEMENYIPWVIKSTETNRRKSREAKNWNKKKISRSKDLSSVS